MPKVFALLVKESGLQIGNLVDYNMQLFDVRLMPM